MVLFIAMMRKAFWQVGDGVHADPDGELTILLLVGRRGAVRTRGHLPVGLLLRPLDHVSLPDAGGHRGDPVSRDSTERGARGSHGQGRCARFTPTPARCRAAFGLAADRGCATRRIRPTPGADRSTLGHASHLDALRPHAFEGRSALAPTVPRPRPSSCADPRTHHIAATDTSAKNQSARLVRIHDRER